MRKKEMDIGGSKNDGEERHSRAWDGLGLEEYIWYIWGGLKRLERERESREAIRLDTLQLMVLREVTLGQVKSRPYRQVNGRQSV